jgi:hypothetical protein
MSLCASVYLADVTNEPGRIIALLLLLSGSTGVISLFVAARPCVVKSPVATICGFQHFCSPVRWAPSRHQAERLVTAI